MGEELASDYEVELPRQIKKKPLINAIIEIHPTEKEDSGPRARIVFAKHLVKNAPYQSKRTSSHHLLYELINSISTNQETSWFLKHSAEGAPSLTSHTKQNLNVSIARSGDWIAAGVSYGALIGIDIERIKPRLKINEKAEFLNWRVEVADLHDFYAKWTLWEASAKCVKGSVLMNVNQGFNELCLVDTRNKVARSGQWSGLHDCLDERLFYAVVLQCENSTNLSHKILCPEKVRPWPATNSQGATNHKTVLNQCA